MGILRSARSSRVLVSYTPIDTCDIRTCYYCWPCLLCIDMRYFAITIVIVVFAMTIRLTNSIVRLGYMFNERITLHSVWDQHAMKQKQERDSGYSSCENGL